MKVIATAISCLALLSCSTESDAPRSPLLGEVVRAPGVVWSTATFDCRQIAREDDRLDALSKANATEQHRLTRARNIQLVEWLIPYYGWVAAARAGILDDQLKRVDVVIEDVGDRREELRQFSLTKRCADTARDSADAAAPAPTITVAPALGRPDAPPSARQHRRAPHSAQAVRDVPAQKAAPVARPPAVVAHAEPQPPTVRADGGMQVQGDDVFLTLGPGADLDRIAAELKSALQKR